MRQTRVLGSYIKHGALSDFAQPLGVRRLPDWSVESFRLTAFTPGQPACLPSVPHSALPASSRWFKKRNDVRETIDLRLDYFEPFGDTIVPLEISTASSDFGSSNFQRNYVPLKLFLEFVRQGGNDDGTTVYLAQCQLNDLPPTLKQDLPIPQIVMNAGNGDIYDANLWMGLPPTYTPLHRDPNPNFFLQLSGQKIVKLYPPAVGGSILTRVHQKLGGKGSANLRGEEMMQGEERKLMEEEVWQPAEDQTGERNKHCQVAILEPGEALFIPLGWWHSIRGVGNAINTSVNFWFR